MAAARGGMPRCLCVQAREVVQASAGLACGIVVEEEVGWRCSASPSHQRRTRGGGAGGWRRRKNSGWPARYGSSRPGQLRGVAPLTSPLLPRAAVVPAQGRHRWATGGCEGRRCRRGSVTLPGGCYYLKRMSIAKVHLPTNSAQCRNISTPTLWIGGTFRFIHPIGGGKQCSLLFYKTAVL